MEPAEVQAETSWAVSGGRFTSPSTARSLRDKSISAGALTDTLDARGSVDLSEERRDRIASSYSVARSPDKLIPLAVVDLSVWLPLSSQNLERDLAQAGATQCRMEVFNPKLSINAQSAGHLAKQVLLSVHLLL